MSCAPGDSRLEGLSLRERRRLRELVVASIPTPTDLRLAVDSHLRAALVAARSNEFVDTALARALASALGEMIDAFSALDGDDQQLVAAAVAYFADADDAAHDFASPIGFEDDARVVNAVARALGRGDLAVAMPD